MRECWMDAKSLSRELMGAREEIYRSVSGQFSQPPWRSATFSNLSGTVYEEIQGVRMPKRGIVGGVEIAVFSRTK